MTQNTHSRAIVSAGRITPEQFRAVADFLGTTDKNIVIGAILQFLIAEGLDPRDAFDVVFGEGAYTKFAGLIYDALNAHNS